MKNLVGACVFAQSGGPTSVINASAAGVFIEALKQKNITAVYGSLYGIKGVLEENLIDISKEDESELMLLKNTPSSALGSVRYKLKDYKVDDNDYKRIVEVFKKYNVRYFFYNGGNDSMDTCNKISKFIKKSGWECNVIGVPKTIDNDLNGTDHCPGFASAARYIATTLRELALDVKVYDIPSICVVETMGRNAGWITASAVLSGVADLIYLPEVVFDTEKFIKDVKAVCDKNKGQCIVVVSEGVHGKDGKLICEQASLTDQFGHTQLGGIASILANLIKKELGYKVRGIELSLMQRCASHIASKTDIEESFNAGKQAVKSAVKGSTDKMVVFKRDKDKNGNYKCKYSLVNLSVAANAEKTVPIEWITNNGTNLSKEFIDYALPLIQGDNKIPYENGLPRYAKLKKIKVEL